MGTYDGSEQEEFHITERSKEGNYSNYGIFENGDVRNFIKGVRDILKDGIKEFVAG